MASENILPSAALAPPPTLREPTRRSPLPTGRANERVNTGGDGLPPTAPTPRPLAPKAGAPRSTMPVLENVRVALMGLAANKLRAALTMLGIIIGVAAVIAMIALGQGAREKTLNQIKSMGTNLLLAEPDFARTGGRQRAGRAAGTSLKPADLEAIQTDCPAVSVRVAGRFQPVSFANAGKSGQPEHGNTTVVGAVWPEWIHDSQLSNLRWAAFSSPTKKRKRPKSWCLGWGVYQQLFPEGGDPTGNA